MNLIDLSLDEMLAYVENLGIEKYRAKQIYEAIYQGKKLENITNLPKSVKDTIKDIYPNFDVIKTLTSSDGTTKILMRFKDCNIVESVLLPYSYGNTVCVSTQVGCRMGCKFCASTLAGLVRNLTAGEILEQVLYFNKIMGDGVKRTVTNVVLMGSGEPLDNYDNVYKFIKLLTCKEGLNISERNISLSTCGIVPNIYRLADEGLNITLTVSLHHAVDEKRKKIMPIANAYSVKEILEACKYYFSKTGRRIIFEYSLISGQNTSDDDIAKLAKALRGLSCHVNLIPLNTVKERSLTGATRKEAYRICEKLTKLGISATVRRTMGEDINGACGQLRASYLEG